MNNIVIILFVVALSVVAIPAAAKVKIQKPSSFNEAFDDDNSTTTTTAATDVPQPEDVKCTLCIDFIEGLENALATEEGTIEGLAGQVCDTLTQDGSSLDALCKEMIQLFIKEIESAIKTSEPPKKICTDIVPLCSDK